MSGANVYALLSTAIYSRKQTDFFSTCSRRDTLQFMREAREQSWSWRAIGEGLGMSGVAAQRYFARNGRKTS